ncbi:hypothetical protein PMI14_00050 [Acidovorax sp. CF316]|uniref:hypothetical protein n=1 Tax=Acidovorax sp. CF316 TaxID=1144317 RepID=UPI00026BD2B5|nr:hypothetical protein [Acidovorax sp. CF316]EJE55050.1 hypothetical protein PMI14_00050 [Acidovorax sp. CF316]
MTTTAPASIPVTPTAAATPAAAPAAKTPAAAKTSATTKAAAAAKTAKAPKKSAAAKPAAAAPKAAAKAPAAKPAATAKTAAKTKAAAAPAASKPAATVAPAKEAKAKKPKLVRDSFTIPKDEYAVVETLKQRAAALAQPAKKSELLRAGLKLLAGLSDTALRSALQAVPSIKTGRPKADAPAAKNGRK